MSIIEEAKKSAERAKYIVDITVEAASHPEYSDILDLIKNADTTNEELKNLLDVIRAANINLDGQTQYKRAFIDVTPDLAERQAYTYIDNVLLPEINDYVRLYKTTQDKQDNFLIIKDGATSANMFIDVYGKLPDLADRLSAAGIPVQITAAAKGTKPIKIDVLKHWKSSILAHSTRIDKIEPFPSNPRIAGSTFNPYRDTTVTACPCDPEEINPIIEHITHNLCSGDDALAEYFINWIAHMFQKPAVLPKIAIALYTAQEGNGKNILTDFLVRCLGRASTNPDVSTEDTKTFTGPICGKTLLIFNEATFSGDHQQTSTMLKLITEETTRYRMMRQDAISVPNWSRVITLTNNGTSGNSAKVGNRRWLTLDCRENVDPNYLRSLANKIGLNGHDKPEYIKDFEGKFVYTMKNLDISKFVPGNLPAQTGGMETKINNSYRENVLQAFLIEWLRDSELTVGSSVYDSERRESLEIALQWTQKKFELSKLRAALEENVKSHPGARMPSRNTIGEKLKAFGIEVIVGNANIRYVQLPHPVITANILKNASRSDKIFDDAQMHYIANWSESATKKEPVTNIVNFSGR